MHIVLVRFSSLGDIIMQSPLFAWLKALDSKIKITLITSKEFSDLAIDHEFIDNVILYEKAKGYKDLKQLKELATKVKKLNPDYIIDLHNTLRAKIFLACIWSIPKIVVYKRSFSRFMLVKFKLNFLKKSSSQQFRVIEDYLYLFEQNFDKDMIKDFIQKKTNRDNFLTSVPQSFKANKPSQFDKNYIVISPVASFYYKRWPIENFNELIKKLLLIEELKDFYFVIVAGPNDNYCQEIAEDERVKNLQGKTTLAQTNEIIANGEFTITNDTGVAHISEAFGVRVLNLFGPTHIDFGFKTHLENSYSLQAKTWCSPCSNTGSKKCARKSHLCMESLTVDLVIKKFKDLYIGVNLA